MKLEFSRQIFWKYSNIKFRGSPSSADRQMDGRTDITKLVIAFRNFANASKNGGLVLGLVNSTNYVSLRSVSKLA